MSTAAQSVESVVFALQDIRCAGCVLKVEQEVSKLSGVQFARGNATQKRLRLVWQEGSQTVESLTKAIANLGYSATEISLETVTKSEKSLLPQLAAAAIGTMNIMAFSFSVWAGLVTDMGPQTMQYLHWFSALVALPVVLYSGAVFVGPAFRALKAKRMTMDTPISLAIWITFLASLFETYRGSTHVYFDAVVSLIFLLLIGRVLEQSLKRRSGDAAANLRQLMQITAHKIGHDGVTRDVSVDELRPEDKVYVKTGERLPADGILLTERVELDESLITGETTPRLILKGAALTAGAIVVTGPAEILVTQVGEDAQIGQMAQMIDEVTAQKGDMQKLSDQFAQGYIPLVIGGGILGFVIWYFLLDATVMDALMVSVAVLIVTCPCAAGLATPAVTSRAVNLLMKCGIVVKSGDVLEKLGKVDRVVFDKTGTVSLPKLKLTTNLPPHIRDDLIALASASRHPLAEALVGNAKVQPISNAIEYPGMGIEAPSGARLGSAQFVGNSEVAGDAPQIWYKSSDGELFRFSFQEEAREDLDVTLEALDKLNLPTSILSGDTNQAVEKFARNHDFKSWIAKQSPKQKLNIIQDLNSKGSTPLMVGDGINDSAVLSGAFVSISFAGATQIAQTAADIILTQPHLRRIPQAISLARHSRKLIVENLVFATVYNIVTVPLALAGLLTPLIAALLMSSSSLVVLANGLRLRMDP